MMSSFDRLLDDEFFKPFRFGFETEFLFPLPDSIRLGDGVEKRTLIAKELSDYLDGQKITVGHNYHDSKKRTDSVIGQLFDHLEPDCSIAHYIPKNVGQFIPSMFMNNNVAWFPCEMSSRTYCAEVGDDSLRSVLNSMETMFSFLAQKQCVTNSSTGFHITMSGFPKKLNWFKIMLLAGTGEILKRFSRNQNSFCESQVGGVFERFGRFEERFKKGTFSLLSDLNDNLSVRQKRRDFHFKVDKNKILEIRSFGGDMYHLRFDEIRFCLLRILNAIKVVATEKYTNKTKTTQKIYKSYIETKVSYEKTQDRSDGFLKIINTDIKSLMKLNSGIRSKVLQYMIANPAIISSVHCDQLSALAKVFKVGVIKKNHCNLGVLSSLAQYLHDIDAFIKKEGHTYETVGSALKWRLELLPVETLNVFDYSHQRIFCHNGPYYVLEDVLARRGIIFEKTKIDEKFIPAFDKFLYLMKNHEKVFSDMNMRNSFPKEIACSRMRDINGCVTAVITELMNTILANRCSVFSCIAPYAGGSLEGIRQYFDLIEYVTRECGSVISYNRIHRFCMDDVEKLRTLYEKSQKEDLSGQRRFTKFTSKQAPRLILESILNIIDTHFT